MGREEGAGRMNIQDEIQNITERVAKELNTKIDERLRYYRGLCHTDAEFSFRMTRYTFSHIIGLTQYCFDGIPVFYSKVTICENIIKIEVVNGEHKKVIDG
jgi:hypothetical protein